MPTVSVITPTYNRPDLLTEAIQSVLGQTFTDFEMLVVEDGSDGSARSVVESFGDTRLRYIYQEHAGRSAARNRGLEAACGDFISLLDDDDLYHPQKLAFETDLLNSTPEIEIAGSGIRLLEKDGRVRTIWEPWLVVPEINAANCLYGLPLITCSVIIRRRALQRLDHWFDPAFDFGEETDLFLRLLLTGATFTWLREVLSDYRLIHKTSPTEILEVYEWGLKVFNKIIESGNFPAATAARHKVLLNYELSIAWKAYAYHLDKTAQRFLLRALIQEPRLADGMSFLLEKGLERTARNTLLVEDPGDFICHVLSHLPSPLKHLALRQEQLLEMVRYPYLDCDVKNFKVN